MTVKTTVKNNVDENQEFDIELKPNAQEEMEAFLLDPRLIFPTSEDELQSISAEDSAEIMNGIKKFLQKVMDKKNFTKLFNHCREEKGNDGVVFDMWMFVSSKLNASGE